MPALRQTLGLCLLLVGFAACHISRSCNVGHDFDPVEHARQLAEVQAKRGVLEPKGSTAVPVYFHLIQDDSGSPQVSDSEINKQLCVLNQAFSGTGFSFFLMDITRTQNSNYANACGLYEAMFPALTVDQASVLNIYICESVNNQDDLLGVAKLPGPNSGTNPNDVVIIKRSSMPDGDETYYNHGDTLVHEVGHYMGLLHVFQGEDCNGPGDEVSDTPATDTPSNPEIEQGLFGIPLLDLCPTGKNSCPNEPGNDPVQNFMDYTPDCCIDRFSEGQISRMRNEVTAWRSQLGVGYTDNGEYGSDSCDDFPTCPEEVAGASTLASFWLS